MKKQYAVFLVLVSFVIIALAAVAGSGSSVSDLPAPPAIGTVIDDFKLPDFDGKEHSLNSRSEEHTSELQSLRHLVCRLLLEKKKKQTNKKTTVASSTH